MDQELYSATHYIDGHCHLADPRFSHPPEALEQALARSRALGITRWIQGGVDPDDWTRQEALALKFPNHVIPCFGLHPWWVIGKQSSEIEKGLLELEKRANKAVGIGELGLDFYRSKERELQIQAFQRQLDLACRLEKPIVLHIVQANETALALLKQYGIPKPGGLVHSFSGGIEVARQYWELGLTLSISGMIARKGFESLKRAVVKIPAESLAVETDAPDQAPDPHEKLNEPSQLIRIAKEIARLRGENFREILEKSTKNLEKVFGLRK